jgi:hypothetical protein
MGQAQLQGVRKVLPGQMAVVTERLLLHATEIKQLASFTYEQLLESITTINEMLDSCSIFSRLLTDFNNFWGG